jgi:hypothetical protein
MNRSLLLALVLAAAPAAGQMIGGILPPARLSNFVGTNAGTLDGYAGRLVLLEFFMYW